MSSPAFILVAPQLGENIGAAARVMANFGLPDLRLVSPRDGWPNAAAETMSAGALPGLVQVQVFDSVEQAIAGRTLVLATTARPRGMEKPVIGAREAAERIRSAPSAAVLFGAERMGLPNEAVTLADAILSFPVDPAFGSLNLAQAVALVAHAHAESNASGPPERFGVGVEAAASKEDLLAMFFDHVLDHRTLLNRPYSFFSIASFIARFSRARSAYMRLSLVFSCSSSLSRLSSETPKPPNLAFHL
jgi:tRNA/rRNA methyltransferase